jgi:hypothetical protein
MGCEITTKYDGNRAYVVYCQRLLECSPKQMKEKIAVMEASEDLGEGVVQR